VGRGRRCRFPADRAHERGGELGPEYLHASLAVVPEVLGEVDGRHATPPSSRTARSGLRAPALSWPKTFPAGPSGRIGASLTPLSVASGSWLRLVLGVPNARIATKMG